jgi:lipid A disaccharide synthetase
MTHEELSKRVQMLCGAVVRLDARCNALEYVLAMVAEHPGLDKRKVWQAVEIALQRNHQELLEALEKTDPALASSLDFRIKHDLTHLD